MSEGRNDRHHHETRHRVDHGGPDQPDDAGHVTREMVRPRLRVREKGEHVAQPLLDEDRHEDHGHDLTERPGHAHDAGPFVHSQVQALSEMRVDPPPDPEAHAEQDPNDHADDERRGGAEPKPPQQHRASSGLLVGADGFLQAFAHDRARLVERLAVVGIQVTLEDPEPEEPIDVDREPLRALGHADLAWSTPGDVFTDALAGSRRALSWQVAEIRGPQGGDVPVEEPDRGRALTGLGASGGACYSFGSRRGGARNGFGSRRGGAAVRGERRRWSQRQDHEQGAQRVPHPTSLVPDVAKRPRPAVDRNRALRGRYTHRRARWCRRTRRLWPTSGRSPR